MAKALVFRSEWVVQVNEMLEIDNDDESHRPNEDEILRVAAPLRKMKPDAYISQFISMGPYHHSIEENEIDSSCQERKISAAEMYKAKAAARLSQKLRNRGESFISIVEMMEKKWPVIDCFYHWPTGISTGEEEYSKNLALMMAVDSLFLIHFIISLSRSRVHPNARSRHDEETPADDHRPSMANSGLSPSLDDATFDLSPLQVCIKRDIMKLENQIPLSLLGRVFESTKEALIYDGRIPLDLNHVLKQARLELSPFQFELVSDDIKLKEALEKQTHLLGYMHAFVSPILEMQKEKGPTVWKILKLILFLPVVVVDLCLPSPTFEQMYQIALNAEKLAKNVIKFKSLSDQHKAIGMDIWSGTLYLPRINVGEMYTEVLLRNIVSSEFNDVTRGTNVMRYVGLMDSLIETHEDVRILRHYGVIATDMVTDESIAKMWNDLAQPFSTRQFRWAPHDHSGALHFVIWEQKSKVKLKRMPGELYDKVSNWKFIGLVAAILGLFMTAA